MPGTNGRGSPVAYINARIVDPASGTDIKGALVTEGGLIRDFGAALFKDAPPFDCERIDCGGKILAPGLVDMRVQLREPGEEHKETIATAAEAASAGGVTAMVCLPNTGRSSTTSPGGIHRAARRGVRAAKVFCYAAAPGLEGRNWAMGPLAEMGAWASPTSRARLGTE
jgi:dihydroorotase